ncbi:MAG: GNAT family N-acetyltransferase [Calditrichia bacterium]
MRFVTNYASDTVLRDSLNKLSLKIFGFTVLKENDLHYMPFSFVDNGKIVANVSVGTFHQCINGKKQIAYMVQTVCTMPDYRKQGLIRRLFQQVDSYINAQNGSAFLLANRNLADFYQQFNFMPIEMAGHFEASPPITVFHPSQVSNVDIRRASDASRLAEYVRRRTSISNVYGDIEQNWLFLWYCDNLFKNDIYYIAELDVFVIYKIEGQFLKLFDIVGKVIPTIEKLYPYIATEAVQKIKYYFTPDKLSSGYMAVVNKEDYLFTRGNFELPKGVFTVPMLARG